MVRAIGGYARYHIPVAGKAYPDGVSDFRAYCGLPFFNARTANLDFDDPRLCKTCKREYMRRQLMQYTKDVGGAVR